MKIVNHRPADLDFGILIHGGVDERKLEISSEEADKISKNLRVAVSDGFDILKKSDSALDSIEAAVAIMEDSGEFNAGSGACLTIDKEREMDASIMNGKDVSSGSVGMVKHIRNPIKLARKVMEHTDHVMLVSDGAIRLARHFNMDIVNDTPTQEILDEFNELYSNLGNDWKKNNGLILRYPKQKHYGTVGAVAIDRTGNVASAVSTGGRWLKLEGRIGDSALIGCGFYADNELGAACATGIGEFIMRLCLCKYACDNMRSYDAIVSARRAIELLTARFGKDTGGLITVDARARFGVASNTYLMPVALIRKSDHENNKIGVSLNQDEKLPI